jgi:hypothetical protein
MTRSTPELVLEGHQGAGVACGRWYCDVSATPRPSILR